MTYRKKLIEVALPLEAINKESAREKSIRHGHPSTLHLWWARRPLATCRAVLFSSLVDDPSSHPDKFPTKEAQDTERKRLFEIIEQLVKWENINNQEVLGAAKAEILKSTNNNPPPVLDPFCGGGSIPLEAQRLGLEAHGSDINPVAVLITKALIEIPPKFANQPPVNPDSRKNSLTTKKWYGAQGLAEDVRYYGQWMRDEAFKRIGHLYPKVDLPQEYGGGQAMVIAWLWARTVKCPNPACGAKMPLVRSFTLSTKKDKQAWVEPIVDNSQQPPVVSFQVKTGKGKPRDGTVSRKGAVCICCDTPVPLDYIRSEGKTGRINSRLTAIVAENKRGRVYLSPNEEHEEIAAKAQPKWKPEIELVHNSRHITPCIYGMTTHADLFTSRQLLALDTLSNLVSEAREKVFFEAVSAKAPDNNSLLCEGDKDATAYADAVATYLGLGVSRLADNNSSLVIWSQSRDQLVHTFGRQALPMVWDFAEANSFSGSAGDLSVAINSITRVLISLPLHETNFVVNSRAILKDATTEIDSSYKLIVSTDPPYYDAVPYADLSDFFYVWLRRSLSFIYPELFSTLLVPKNQELVADPFRHGNREQAKEFFEEGLRKVFNVVRKSAHPDYPFSVYYAFKQAETDEDNDEKGNNQVNIASTGWETMLEGLIQSGFSITATLPMRTEKPGRLRDIGSNALASSIVLVCRPRPETAPSTTRRQFVNILKRELPDALQKLQQGNIAPVDLAQASIGPGMAIYSRYSKVIESDGKEMPVRTALQLINQTLDEFLAEQEGEFDAETRFALIWYEQHTFTEGLFGDAETLSKAKNTAVQGMVDAGILTAKAGKVRLLRRDELPKNWNPQTDNRLTVWEATQHMIRELQDGAGNQGAANLLSQLGTIGEAARELAYRLYNICDRKGWAAEGVAYNSLVISWPEISRLAAETEESTPLQMALL
ncbi:DUF1156 domain-containing protein [Nostoc sp. UIC 10630]|uniref:DUF1156 domain-containing protein n=1 Tax=Nostoc sp. UIC 10630 TaxID=2100146 RepID=UPI0013D68CFE|nr:DUF1156 domain-containing protein [Nostoc sp. UIC 10630]NEU78982.1 DUF1156 domain-containing protein [Nostoc sp. UIC 10630]